jgi:hypothetical protein
MFSVRFKKPDNSRLDQCDNPVSRGGLHRVCARIRAPELAPTPAGGSDPTASDRHDSRVCAGRLVETVEVLGIVDASG